MKEIGLKIKLFSPKESCRIKTKLLDLVVKGQGLYFYTGCSAMS